MGFLHVHLRVVGMDVLVRIHIRDNGSSVIVGHPFPGLLSASWQPDFFHLLAVRRIAADCHFVHAYLCISGVDGNRRELEGHFLGPWIGRV